MNERFVVGIDLGTTNCAVAYADTAAAGESRVTALEIPQLVSPGEVQSRPLLPSFMYLPGDLDFPAGATALPWDPHPAEVVGELARRRGAENPSRLVASAKSWLSYGGARRTAPILPFGAPDDLPHVSPVDAAAGYLRHLAAAFDRAVANGDPELVLAAQDVLVTVPASFDEDARELTLRAARAAGLGDVTLLEEPQSAFYAWLDARGDSWRRRVVVGDLILVCDVGGGTTDFSLIAVSERAGDLALERVAVGEHILLGGDNMDLALARLLQQRLEAAGHRIDSWHLQGLWHQARLAKEALLANSAQPEQAVTLLGRGSRLVGAAMSTALTQEDVSGVLREGFFPAVARTDMPVRPRRAGLQELGLPYAADAAVTRHLAKFLSRATAPGAGAAVRRGPGGMACPTHVLFNGGVMKAAALRARVVEVLNHWLGEEGFAALDDRHVLETDNLDHAVAIGAASYGLARRGRGIRIRSGAARTYYLGIERALPAVPGLAAPLKALCVVPFGMEEGTSQPIPGREFGLVVGEPAEFRFLSSTVRKGDAVGVMIEDWGDDLEELSPLDVVLPVDGDQDAVVPVSLESRVTETGVMEIWCVSRDGQQRWKLERSIREQES